MNKTMTQAISKLSIAAVLAAGSISANAFDIENDGWTFSVHGNINAHYIYNECDDSAAASSATAPAFGLLCAGSQNATAISNGYLPTSFEFALATQSGGYDITVHTGVDRGLDTNQAFNAAGDGIGFRNWMTVSSDDLGTVTLGRTWGLFGYDATFQDMSVFGVGGPFGTASPSNTSLGGAGTGYIFLDRITQATWTLPTSDSVVAQIGLYQPLDVFGSATNTSGENPGIHGRFRFNFEGGFVSVTGLTQDVEVGVAPGAAATSDFRASAVDLTGQINLGPVSLTASYFMSDGAGHTGILIDPINVDGSAKESDGYLVQAVYTAGSTRYGLNYGITEVDNIAADAGTGALKEKSKITAGVYHSLASGITLTAEFSQLEAESAAGTKIENDVASVGAIFFF